MLLFAALATYLMSPLSRVARFSTLVLILVGGMVVISGLLRLRRAHRVRGSDDGESRLGRRRRAARERDERNFARWWIGAGFALAMGLLLLPPVAIAVTGMVVATVLAARGRNLSMRRAGAAIGCTVVMAILAAGLYGVVAVAEVVTSFSHADGAGGGGSDEGDDGGEGEKRALDYAQLCPSLPDPLEIAHGLGELFKHDGAVEAGCGGPAEEVAGARSVWFSLGMCEGSLRSLAVGSEAHEAVLLYGEPAQFAWRAARAGRLLYAEVAKPGAGDLDIVTTVDGSYVFARSTPSIRPGSETAERCAQVDEVARPFVMLPPPLAELWAQDVFESGWSWPLKAGQESYAFFDAKTEELHAQGACHTESSCSFQVLGAERRTFSGAVAVSLDELEDYAPPTTE